MYCPPVNHDNRPFGDKEAFIPIILMLDCRKMLVPLLRNGFAQNLFMGRHLITSFTMALTYGKFGSSAKFGGRSDPMTRSNSS
jgi:hypothetical protein